MEFLLIFIAAFIQGGYDYLGWKGIFNEQSGHKYEWLYRLIKELLDFPVTMLIMICWLSWSADLITAFYLLKWFGWCDAFYIAIWKLFHPRRDYTQEGIWWMWWTPLGISRSEVVYRADPLPAKAGLPLNKGEIFFMHLFGNWYFKKGVISYREFLVQLVIGVILSYAVYNFKTVTYIYKLIFN